MNDQAPRALRSERRLRIIAGAWVLALLIFAAALATLSGWGGMGLAFLVWSLLAIGLLIASRRYVDLVPQRARLLAAFAALLWALLLYCAVFSGDGAGYAVDIILQLMWLSFPVALTAITLRRIQQRSVAPAI